MENDKKEKFKPTFGTCYRPDLNMKNKCNECEFNGYAHCKEHSDFGKFKKEFNEKYDKK